MSLDQLDIVDVIGIGEVSCEIVYRVRFINRDFSRIFSAGQYILEVSLQNNHLPQAALDTAYRAGVLKVGPTSLSALAKASQHQPDRRPVKECECVSIEALPVPA